MVTDESRIARRRYVAERILASYGGQASGKDVLAEIRSEDFNDPVLEELLDLFEHQPAKSRWWGLWGAAYDAYVDDVRTMAQEVISDATIAPRSRR